MRGRGIERGGFGMGWDEVWWGWMDVLRGRDVCVDLAREGWRCILYLYSGDGGARKIPRYLSSTWNLLQMNDCADIRVHL
jgi:hypothetical protein